MINVLDSVADHNNKPTDPSASQEVLSYYQRSILTIFSSVKEVYGNILLQEELDFLEMVMERLPSDAQRLLFRLYLRKAGWLRRNRLEYQDITDMENSIDNLIQLQVLEYLPSTPEEVVEILQLEELKLLARELGVKTTGKSRDTLINNILAMKKSGQMRLSFLGHSRKSIADEATDMILSKGRMIAGPVIRLDLMIRTTLDRLFGLYFLEVAPAWEATNLSTAILTDLNRIKYPSYEIVRSRPVFYSREQWLNYEEAIAYERSIQETLEIDDSLNESSIKDILTGVKDKWHQQFESNQCLHKDSYFLQRFSPGWVYTRLLATFVPLLERSKAHEEANRLLELLLEQKVYCHGMRGRWWERLVLNLDRHLNNKAEALRIAENALQDPHVKTASRLALERRLFKGNSRSLSSTLLSPSSSLSSSSSDRHQRIQSSPENQDDGPPIITIYADPEDRCTNGRKLLYLLPQNILGSVEELALSHFEDEKWKGIQTESRLYRMLFSLLFWDIIFCSDIPDVFQTPHQVAPLDLLTDAFYAARRNQIEERLALIGESIHQASGMMAETYKAQYGCHAMGVQWEEYSITLLQDICHSLGSSAITPIMRVLAEDYAASCSGLPDLLLYRPDCSDYLLVEVKSTNDRLSDAQKNWHIIFRRHGIKHAICRVLDTSAQDKPIKRKRRNKAE